MPVVWSIRAHKTFLCTLKRILEKWTVREGEAFEKKVYDYVDRLKTNNELCPASKISHLRKCLIAKQTSLIYKLSDDKIILVAFIDNRSDHKF